MNLAEVHKISDKDFYKKLSTFLKVSPEKAQSIYLNLNDDFKSYVYKTVVASTLKNNKPVVLKGFSIFDALYQDL